MITDEGHKIVYSVLDKYHQQEVAFIVRKELTTSIINYRTVSSRISIRISSQPVNMTIIQIYTPSHYNDEDIEVFYEQLNYANISQQYKEDLESKLADININELSNDNAYAHITVNNKYSGKCSRKH